MKSTRKITGMIMAALAIMALSGTAAFAKIDTQNILGNSDLFVLTQNHARTVAYDLDASVGGANGLHALYILGLDLDAQSDYAILSILIANNTPMTKGEEIVYFISGGVLAWNTKTGTAVPTPLLQYQYASAGTYSVSITVPKTTYGVVLIGVLRTNVDFPVTFGTTISLKPHYTPTN